MKTPTTYEEWYTSIVHVDQSLALAKVLREVFWGWENDYSVGTRYRLDYLTPVDLRQVMDLMTSELSKASGLMSDMEPNERIMDTHQEERLP